MKGYVKINRLLTTIIIAILFIIILSTQVVSATPRVEVHIYGPNTTQKLLPNTQYLFIVTLAVHDEDVNEAYLEITVYNANANCIYLGNFDYSTQKSINNELGYIITLSKYNSIKKDTVLAGIIYVSPLGKVPKISIKVRGYVKYKDRWDIWSTEKIAYSNEINLNYKVIKFRKITPKEYLIKLAKLRIEQIKTINSILNKESINEINNLWINTICDVYAITEVLVEETLESELTGMLPSKYQLIYELYKLSVINSKVKSENNKIGSIIGEIFENCEDVVNHIMFFRGEPPYNNIMVVLLPVYNHTLINELYYWQTGKFKYYSLNEYNINTMKDNLNAELDVVKKLKENSLKLIEISKRYNYKFAEIFFGFLYNYMCAEEKLIKDYLMNVATEPNPTLVGQIPSTINLKEGNTIELIFKVKNNGGFINGTEGHLTVSVSDGLEIIGYSSSDTNMVFKMLDSNTLDCHSNYKPGETKVIRIKIKAKKFKNENQFIKYKLKFLPLIKPKALGNYVVKLGKIDVKVTPINWPPKIVDYNPKSSIIYLKEKEKAIFSVKIYDKDGSYLSYKWLLNGKVVAVGRTTYTLEAKVGDGGKRYDVELVASDGWSEVRHKWIVYVIRNPSIGHNVRLISIEVPDTEFYSGETANFQVYVENMGNYTEICNVCLIIMNDSDYRIIKIINKNIQIRSGFMDSVDIDWNIPKDVVGYYTVTAIVSPKNHGDEDPSDNVASIVIHISKESPHRFLYKAYIYKSFLLKWNKEYRIPDWFYSGAMNSTWIAPNGHTYCFEIGEIAYGLGDHHYGIGINIIKDGKYIYKTLAGERPARWLIDSRSYYFDNYKLILWDITHVESINGTDMLWFKAGVPTSDVEISPFESYCHVGEVCKITIKLPPNEYDINPRIWLCNKNNQPDILKEKFSFLKSVYSNGNTVVIEFKPTEPGTFVFAVEGIRIRGSNCGYLVFGILHVVKSIKTSNKISSTKGYHENITDSRDLAYSNDIKFVHQAVSEDRLTFKINYYSLNPSNIITLVFLDTDKNAKTGYSVNDMLIKHGLLSHPIGADYVIEIVRLPSSGAIQKETYIPVQEYYFPNRLIGYLLKWNGKMFSLIREIPIYSDTDTIEFSVSVSDIGSNRADVVVVSGISVYSYSCWGEQVYCPAFTDVAPDYRVTTWCKLYSDSDYIKLPADIPDIRSVYINKEYGMISIKIEMNNSINVSNFLGMIFIDADRSALTGCPVNDYVNRKHGGPIFLIPNLGAEYLVKIYPSQPFARSSVLLAELDRWNDKTDDFEYVHTLRAHVNENSLWISIPASFIGNNTNIKLAVAVGTYTYYDEWLNKYEYAFTDVAPDFKVNKWVKLYSDEREYAPFLSNESLRIPDIKNVYINLTDDIFSLKVEMYNPINFSNFVCMIFIDVDHNSSTGCPVNKYLNSRSDYLLLTTSNIGAEYAIDIRSSYAIVNEWTNNNFQEIEYLFIHNTTNSIWVSIPRSVIGGCNKARMIVAVGEIVEYEPYPRYIFTDVAPDFNISKWKEIYLDNRDVKLPGAPDIKGIYLNLTDNMLSIKVEMYNKINFSNFTGIIFIDADKNPSTGCSVKEYMTKHGYDAHKIPNIGAEYIVKIFTNIATLYKWDGRSFENIVGELLLQKTVNSIWVTIPTSLISNSNDVKLVVAVGTYRSTGYGIKYIFADTAPDNILYVPDDFKSIQDAIDAAIAGSTIIVRDGTYIGNVVVDKPLTIVAENLAKSKVVPSDKSKPVFTILSDNVSIIGFSIHGGSVGIEVLGQNCNILNNEITNNNIGIRILSPNVNVSFNHIVSCKVGIAVGNGIQIRQTGNIIKSLSNVILTNNSLPLAPIPEIATIGLVSLGVLCIILLIKLSIKK